MREKDVILGAKTVSLMFKPFYLPIVGLASLLTFTYLSMLPWTYKVFLLLITYLFTAFVPTVLIRFYHNYHGWKPIELGSRERRIIPYLISILSYMFCHYVMQRMHMPYFIGTIVITALVIQIACAMTNLVMKISTHTAAIGGFTGATMAFSIILNFNPVWWLCGLITLAGLGGTSRMILRQHTLGEVVFGFLLGTVCSFVTVLVV